MLRTPLTVMALMATLTVWAQAQSHGLVSVAFSIDGKAASCKVFGVELRLDGKVIDVRSADHGFYIPDQFKTSKAWRDDQRVDITLTCDNYNFVFQQQHPGFIREGEWELGIARPPYSVERFRRTSALEHGAWLAFLIFEGEPGVVTFAPQPDPPSRVVEAILKEQPSASGRRARDIAYALAVYGVEYDKNRDSLLHLLNRCLSRPRESAEDDECDSELLDFVTNLYWRGDGSLLLPLLRMADTRRDVIGEICTFYSDLLDRRQETAIGAIEEIDANQQHLVCKLAYEDDLSIDGPKRDRVRAFLAKTPGDTAARCLADIEQ